MEVNQILIDTNIYAALRIKDPVIVDIIRHVDLIGLNPVILGELLGGFANGSKEQQNRHELGQFTSQTRIKVFPIEAATAKYYALVYANLRKKGCPIPTSDMWIAATALEHGLMVCTYDKHFAQIDGLLMCKNVTDLVL